MLKYGGNGTTEIFICDRIVNDRIISHIIRLLIVPQKSFDELKKNILKHIAKLYLMFWTIIQLYSAKK